MRSLTLVQGRIAGSGCPEDSREEVQEERSFIGPMCQGRIGFRQPRLQWDGLEELQPGASPEEKGLKRQIECWEQLGQISLVS